MESENKDILERNVSEKMCSSGSNGAGEICSLETADTCGDGMFIVQTPIRDMIGIDLDLDDIEFGTVGKY